MPMDSIHRANKIDFVPLHLSVITFYFEFAVFITPWLCQGIEEISARETT